MFLKEHRTYILNIAIVSDCTVYRVKACWTYSQEEEIFTACWSG